MVQKWHPITRIMLILPRIQPESAWADLTLSTIRSQQILGIPFVDYRYSSSARHETTESVEIKFVEPLTLVSDDSMRHTTK